MTAARNQVPCMMQAPRREAGQPGANATGFIAGSPADRTTQPGVIGCTSRASKLARRLTLARLFFQRGSA